MEKQEKFDIDLKRVDVVDFKQQKMSENMSHRKSQAHSHQQSQKDQQFQNDAQQQAYKSKSCIEKLKYRCMTIKLQLLNYLQFDQLFDNETDCTDTQQMRKVSKYYQNGTKKRYGQIFTKSYTQRQRNFGYTFEQVLQERELQIQRKQKNFWPQFKRFICCQGGNEMDDIQDIDPHYYQFKGRKKLLNNDSSHEIPQIQYQSFVQTNLLKVQQQKRKQQQAKRKASQHNNLNNGNQNVFAKKTFYDMDELQIQEVQNKKNQMKRQNKNNNYNNHNDFYQQQSKRNEYEHQNQKQQKVKVDLDDPNYMGRQVNKRGKKNSNNNNSINNEKQKDDNKFMTTTNDEYNYVSVKKDKDRLSQMTHIKNSNNSKNETNGLSSYDNQLNNNNNEKNVHTSNIKNKSNQNNQDQNNNYFNTNNNNEYNNQNNYNSNNNNNSYNSQPKLLNEGQTYTRKPRQKKRKNKQQNQIDQNKINSNYNIPNIQNNNTNNQHYNNNNNNGQSVVFQENYDQKQDHLQSINLNSHHNNNSSGVSKRKKLKNLPQNKTSNTPDVDDIPQIDVYNNNNKKQQQINFDQHDDHNYSTKHKNQRNYEQIQHDSPNKKSRKSKKQKIKFNTQRNQDDFQESQEKQPSQSVALKARKKKTANHLIVNDLQQVQQIQLDQVITYDQKGIVSTVTNQNTYHPDHSNSQKNKFGQQQYNQPNYNDNNNNNSIRYKNIQGSCIKTNEFGQEIIQNNEANIQKDSFERVDKRHRAQKKRRKNKKEKISQVKQVQQNQEEYEIDQL